METKKISSGEQAFKKETDFIRGKNAERLRKTCAHLILLAGSIFFLFPLVWMVSTSLKSIDKTMLLPPQWLPDPFQWSNYAEAVKYIDFFLYTKNTVFVCLFSVIGTLLSSSLAAYGFSRIEWKGREVFFWLTLSTMMVPFPVLMVPLYGVFRSLHWIGTLKPLWVPAFFGSAFNIFLLRQFFMGIPKDLSEAARIDGCSEIRIWATLILPLAKPALAVVALFQFIYNWNDFLGPVLFLTRQEDYTLALGLQFYQSQNGGTQWHFLMAASTLTALPIFLLFFFAQKTFIRGIAMSGLKE
jgi:multiple sugar transport system permease protein